MPSRKLRTRSNSVSDSLAASSAGMTPSTSSGSLREGDADMRSRGFGLDGSAASSRQLAVKVLRKGQGGACDIERQIMWEVHVLTMLHHSHIVKVIDAIDVVDATYIVMEQIDGPELSKHILSQPSGRLPLEQACRYFCHLVAALDHAHTRGVLHCDVKSENVRLCKRLERAVLTDWGLALPPGASDEDFVQCTPAYAAPEQLTSYDADSICGKRSLCAAVDIWSAGVTLFEMVVGTRPFAHAEPKGHHALARCVLRLDYSFPLHVPDDVRALIRSMLQVSPCERATLAEIMLSPWLVGSGCLLPKESPQHASTGRGEGLKSYSKLGSMMKKRPFVMIVAAFYLMVCLGALWSNSGSNAAGEHES